MSNKSSIVSQVLEESKMTNTPRAIANEVTLTQGLLCLVSSPLLFFFEKAFYLFIGWGAVLISNSTMFFIASQSPSISNLLIGELFKYGIFSLILYTSLQLQPQAWPYALYGVAAGQVSYVLSCIIIGRVYGR